MTEPGGTTTAARLFERARRHVPGGVHSNTRFRRPWPFFAGRASGAYQWDVDGQRHLDLQMGNGSVALGHAHPQVDAAVQAAIGSGLTTGAETAAAVQAAEALAGIVPGCGLVRFANTGTEALMHAVRIARHATGRSRVAKAEGAYHGWYDPLWISAWATAGQLGEERKPASPPGSAGLSAEAAGTVVLPFNDAEASEDLLRATAGELAAVVVEPVLIDIGFVPADPGYLRGLREVCTELGIILIFDELLTGFRLAPGGAREVYGITADLTTYGKAMSNGYPLAAVEGTAELLGLTDPDLGGPVGWVGTYNGHPAAMAAAAAALPLLADGTAQDTLDRLTDDLRAGFADLSARYGIPAVLAGGGGHFQPYFLDEPPRSYREALRSDTGRYEIWARTLEREHILVPARPLLHCALSTAHGAAELELLLAATEQAFIEMGRNDG